MKKEQDVTQKLKSSRKNTRLTDLRKQLEYEVEKREMRSQGQFNNDMPVTSNLSKFNAASPLFSVTVLGEENVKNSYIFVTVFIFQTHTRSLQQLTMRACH